MSEVILSVLRSNRIAYEAQLNEAYNTMSNIEHAYDSLCEFKTIVIKSEEEFHSLNGDKKSILEGIESIKDNSITAQRYYSRMKVILSKFGPEKIGAVYSILISSISYKLGVYSNIISNCEEKIGNYNRLIGEIDAQIEEELMKQNMGG